jgi:hypothetical protein
MLPGSFSLLADEAAGQPKVKGEGQDGEEKKAQENNDEPRLSQRRWEGGGRRWTGSLAHGMLRFSIDVNGLNSIIL